jgi:hypothetical protein
MSKSASSGELRPPFERHAIDDRYLSDQLTKDAPGAQKLERRLQGFVRP